MLYYLIYQYIEKGEEFFEERREMFKKKKGINVPYNKQGLIYFVCLDFKNQPRRIQEKIEKLCDEIGGDEYKKALFEFVTTDSSAVKISLKHYLSEGTLYVLRKKFYEKW